MAVVETLASLLSNGRHTSCLSATAARQRQWRLAAALLLLLSLLPVTYSGKDNLVRNTDKGRVRGIRYWLPVVQKSVDAFLGIPFAKPPISHLRFKHPEPMEQWKGIINATKLPNSCYQSPDTFFGDFYGSNVWNPTTRVSEDCLYANVWVPRTQPRVRNSAVMVWIYGGGFYSGTTTLNIYDGRMLAAINDVIVVSIAYRVGVLGFLSVGHASAPGNAGMFDQLMGLEWVKNNIHYFGGDPNNVTLFGESAGSVSVSLHLLSPLSRHKFQRVILQSGVPNMHWATLTQEEAKSRALDMAINYLHCEDTDDMEVIVDCLRKHGPHTLVEKQWVTRGILQYPFVPVIDGIFLVESPAKTLERRSFKKCPILLGSNNNEGSWFIIYEMEEYLNLERKSMSREEFLVSTRKLFYHFPQYPNILNDFGLQALRYQYSNYLDPDDVDTNLKNLEAAVAHSHFICPVNEFANAYASAGENVYMYYLTQRYSTSPWPKWMGVLHGDDIFFVFGEILKENVNYTQDEKQLSTKMMQYWTNFAKTGDPNRFPGAHSLEEWPQHTPNGKEYLELNTKFLKEPVKSKAVGRGPHTNECVFWSSYLPNLIAGTADIREEERLWKLQFKEWSTKYIVDWKLQYERFLRNLNQCPGGNGNE